LREITEHWTIIELFEAHAVLDALDAAEVRASRRVGGD
jgi:hypothetical protein